MSEEPSLGKKTFFAALWTVGSRMMIRFIGLISLVILAKILGPEDYGLVAKAAIVFGFLEMATQLGLESALITNQKATKDHYSSAWTIHIIRGILIALILVAIAIPAAKIMKEDRIEHIIYCYALIALVGGFYNIGVADFRKYMIFSKDFYYSLYQKISGFIVTITIAVIWETYWALIAGIAASTITRIISSFWMSKVRLRLTLSKFGTLFDFSKWMVTNELIDAASAQVDRLLLSIYSTTANMGLYVMSHEVAGVPTNEIAMPVARACTPSFSKVKENLKEFSKLYGDSLSICLIIIIPAASGVSILAEPIVLVLLDDDWLEAVPVIQVLAFFGLCRASLATFFSAALAYNRPDILTKTTLIKAVYSAVILVFAIIQYGFMGLVWGMLVVEFINLLIAQSIMWKMNILSITDLFKNAWRTVLATAAMVYGLSAFLQIDMSFLEGLLLIELLIDTAVGILIYAITLILLWVLCGKVDGPEKAILGTLLKGRWGTA